MELNTTSRRMKITYKIVAFLLIGSLIWGKANAQLNPLTSQYFTNQYLVNPAFAGQGSEIKINSALRKLWSGVPGSPITQSITADYGFNKVGIGLNIYNEKAGLLKQTRIVGSYAYHLPLTEEETLHFGISMGLMNQRLEATDIHGNPNDPMVGLYNERKTYLDGDFGIAYTSNKLSIQASIPNLKSTMQKDVNKQADVSIFYSAICYKFHLGEVLDGMDLEPKLAYRGVKGFDNIWDAGAQLEMSNNQVFLLGLYHSTQNTTFGLGMNFKKKYLISGMYTSQTSALSAYTNGSFELNLRLNLSTQ